MSRQFVRQSLTHARNRKGFSMQDIAEAIGVQRQYIYKVETGRENKFLSEEQLEKIASKLGVSSEYFYTDIKYTINDDRLHFRSITIPKYTKESAKILAEDIVSICMFLKEYIRPLGLSFPLFQLDDLIDSSVITNKELHPFEIEKISNSIRKSIGLGDGPISNMVRVLESQGIFVASFSCISEKVDAFCNDDYLPIVIYNNKKSSVRGRFDLAHEFAHLVIHKGEINDTIHNRFLEKQANYFASCFLLPRGSFLNEFPRFHNGRIPWLHLIELKKRWKVSIAAMIMRANQLNIISAEDYKKAFIYISRKGWRSSEPMDDPDSDYGYIEPESPEMIKNAVKMIINSYPNMLSEMKKDLKIDAHYIKKLLDMPSLNINSFDGIYKEHKNYLRIVR